MAITIAIGIDIIAMCIIGHSHGIDKVTGIGITSIAMPMA